MHLPDIRAQYPRFESIFQKEVEGARFDGVLKRSSDFKVLKVEVVSLWHLQAKHEHLPPATRSALVQALLVEHDFLLALQLIYKTNGSSNGPGMVTRALTYLSGSKGDETFKNQMRSAAANLPDSQFLQRLESIDDDDLRSTVQNARALAQKNLSHSIDAVVRKLTHAVLAMQQDYCRMSVQVEGEHEERKVLDDALVEFIREINKCSAGRGTS